MSIAFVKEWAQFRTTSPASSASTTPGAAGNILAVFGQNESAGVITPSAAAGTQVNPPALVVDGFGDSHAISVNLSLTAGAQVATLTGASGAQTLEGEGYEYSGVGNRSNGASVTRTNPGGGAGAITGSAVTVAVGDVLLVNVKCVTAITSNAIACIGGTIRGHSENNSPFPTYVTAEFAGTGGSITPTFTDVSNGASQSYQVSQIVLNASGGTTTISVIDDPRRPRPGRGPYSLGQYFRPSIDTAYPLVRSNAAIASDSISLSDSAVEVANFLKSASDSVTLSDSAVEISTLPRTASDTLSLSDSATEASLLPRTASDTLTLSDSGVAVYQPVGVKTATDTLTLSDSAVELSALTCSASDSLNLSDSGVCVNPNAPVVVATSNPGGGGGGGKRVELKKKLTARELELLAALTGKSVEKLDADVLAAAEQPEIEEAEDPEVPPARAALHAPAELVEGLALPLIEEDQAEPLTEDADPDEEAILSILDEEARQVASMVAQMMMRRGKPS